jgi:hypothetical protein
VEPTVLEGHITHLRFDVDSAKFRINGGAVVCEALQPWSLVLAQHKGYPGHDVRVAGELRQNGNKKVLAITALTLVN